LVTGASGSGKELIARALHRSSLADGPFVPVNCGAIPDQLIESELFGVKKGAFTDAKADRTGMLDAAAGGTLFLDEIGEMPLQVQAKLLRVLQEEEFTPLGDTKRRKLNARIICATNRDLPAMIAEKKFREDLYYRIAVITLRVPTLAERKDDIETLTRFFLDKFNRRFGKNLQMPNEHELAEMTAYDWPGNVRELHNSIERAAVLSTGPRIDLEHVLPVRDFVVHAPDSKHLVGDFKTSLRRFERQYLQSLLEASHGNLSEASRVSGIYRATIYRMARRLNIAIGKDL
jgi:DNA-binding NtrC family response regulator